MRKHTFNFAGTITCEHVATLHCTDAILLLAPHHGSHPPETLSSSLVLPPLSLLILLIFLRERGEKTTSLERSEPMSTDIILYTYKDHTVYHSSKPPGFRQGEDSKKSGTSKFDNQMRETNSSSSQGSCGGDSLQLNSYLEVGSPSEQRLGDATVTGSTQLHARLWPQPDG